MTSEADWPATLRDVLGPGIGIAARKVGAPLPLWSQEEPAMAHARLPRVAEFSTGRACARAAMAELGLPAAPIPMGSDRAPVWPDDVLGSISHGTGLCIAMIARKGRYGGLGVDIEPDDPMPDNVARLVLTAQDAPVETADERVVFCVKEAVYKAFYPITGQVWAFDAVHVRLLGSKFEAVLARPVPGWPDRCVVRGHVIRRDGVIVTALALSPIE